jgi:SAM-dependent methyltransferase
MGVRRPQVVRSYNACRTVVTRPLGRYWALVPPNPASPGPAGVATADAWPGADRRDPPRGDPSWSIRRPLADWLRAEGRAAGSVRVLDVGCGVEPYRPFFAGAAAYVGVDVVENPVADLLGPVEALPVEDASFDVVLCNQVLEHCDDPARAVRELRRVTAPGGRVLASTHGVQVYHPSPGDYWRWTHAGLTRLFEENADWSSVEVVPGAGTVACLGMLIATYVDLLAQRLHAVPAGAVVVAAVNSAAAALDRRSRLLREPVPGSLIANFHVTAVR